MTDTEIPKDNYDAIIEEFLSKTDYDFSTVKGWEDYLHEKTELDDLATDGLQLRDFKFYPIGAASIFDSGGPIQVRIDITTIPRGMQFPAGMLYVYYPNENWEFEVRSIYLGANGQNPTITVSFKVAGKGTPEEPHWGSLFFTAIKGSAFRGEAVTKKIGRKALNQALKQTSKLVRIGTKALTLGGVEYNICLTIQGRRYYLNSAWTTGQANIPQTGVGKKTIEQLNDLKNAIYAKLKNKID